MHQFLYTTLWICFLFYLVCSVDGRRKVKCGEVKASGRIKGGEKASIKHFPWAVTLRVQRFNLREVHCGGSIIDKKWVLTAAHCLTGRRKPVWITAGQTKGSSLSMSDNFKIKSYHKHPNFFEDEDPETKELLSIGDDIALLELESEFPISESVKPICLSRTDVKKDQRCQVVGWGKKAETGPHSSQLMKINLNIDDVDIKESCDNLRDQLANLDDIICTQRSTKQTCFGDSGGPLTCKENGRDILKGVLSISTITCDEAEGTSSFTKVAKYLDWIEQVTQLEFVSVTNPNPPTGLPQPTGRPQPTVRPKPTERPKTTKRPRTTKRPKTYKIANAGSGMDSGGNVPDTPNLAAMSAEKSDGLSNDVSPMSTNSASKSLTTSKIFLFVGGPIFIIGLIVMLVGATVVIQKSSHTKKYSLEMTAPLPEPDTK